MTSFLDLPAELRLHIYAFFLADHRRVRRKLQPSNAHFRLLHTCSFIASEAGVTFRRYVSLLHERQIHAFLLYAEPSLFAHIEWADVANDGRVFHSADRKDQEVDDTPLSNLHIALGRMTALKRLRVFHCRQGLSINLQNTMSLHSKCEAPLKVLRDAGALSYYELYLNPETRVDAFDKVRPTNIVALRFSGEISSHAAKSELPRLPALRHVTLHGITGNFFEMHTMDECFPDAHLESFSYALGHRLGFEIRNHHLESLASVHGHSLRKLVLLGCSRLSTTVISKCLESLPALEYFALHLVTVDELRSNFVIALPQSLSVFKLQVINAWYAVACKDEERGLCNSIEDAILRRGIPLNHVCVCFRNQLMAEDGRQERWMRIAGERKFRLEIGPWESRMMENM